MKEPFSVPRVLLIHICMHQSMLIPLNRQVTLRMCNKVVPSHLEFLYQDVYLEGCCPLRYSAALLLYSLESSLRMIFSPLHRAASGTLSAITMQWYFSFNTVCYLFVSSQFHSNFNCCELSLCTLSLCILFYFWVCFLFHFILFPGAFKVLRSFLCFSHWDSIAQPWQCVHSHFLF